MRPYAAEHLGSVYVEQGRFREAVEMYLLGFATHAAACNVVQKVLENCSNDDCNGADARDERLPMFLERRGLH